MRRPRIVPVLLVAGLLAAVAAYMVPRGIEASELLAIEDDPVRIADRALDEIFTAELASREIEQALAEQDSDLAQSFVELGAARHVTLDPALTERVNAAVAEAKTARHAGESFALGLVTGEPNDMAGLAGTTLGDLFVFGDLRDAVREGGRLAMGEPADELLLGLACVGLAITAGTYATLGAAAPARIGLSVAKVARKTGRLGADLAATVARSLRGVVDWGRLKKAIVGASISEPALAIHAVREAVKIERAGGLLHLVRDVGRVQARAGKQAALDGLKVVESPREMGRVAKLAEKEGSRTRAILKTVGRGAIALTVASVELGLWILGALFAVFALLSSLKSTTERVALRMLRRRKQGHRQRLVAFTARA
ncbi:MAG: hypothetical protein ACREB8_05945 [Pseudolabrys sp.]